MADGKWIEGVRADQPPDVAARLVLAARLAVVRNYLPRAMHHAEDPENVHQLRVGTRRADAALRIFRDCLPAKSYLKARKHLRSLRRAAGEARDWDVFALELTTRRRRAHAKEHPGMDFLLGQALGHRAVAQAGLIAVALRESSQFDSFVAETCDSVRPPEPPIHPPLLVGLARPVLSGLRARLHLAATADLTDYSQLHQVRIAGKRLRYAMEVFAECFGPSFREQLYPRIEQMQEILGLANDSHVATHRLTLVCERMRAAWPAEWERFRPGVEALLHFHQRRLPREKRHFLDWWKHWQSDGEAVFDSVLA